MVQHDFHEPMSGDYSGMKFDLIYSNSHDHCRNPTKALSTWLEQLSDSGCLILEHSRSHGRRYQSDIHCWGIEPEILPFFYDP